MFLSLQSPEALYFSDTPVLFISIWFLRLLIISLPILFYIFVNKARNEKRADLIVILACCIFIIYFIFDYSYQIYAYGGLQVYREWVWFVFNFPLLPIFICLCIGLKFYSLDFFNKINGVNILKIIVAIVFFLSLVRLAGSFFSYQIDLRLSIIYAAMALLWNLYFRIISGNIDLSFNGQKSNYSRDHPSNW